MNKLLIVIKQLRSFTLLELMVTLIIIGILGTIAIGHFSAPRERALDNEAMSNLKLIQAAQRIYRMETGNFYTSPGPNHTADLNTNLKLDLSTRNWRYATTVDFAFNLHAKARRNSPPDGWGRDFYIDQDNAAACCCSSDSRCISSDWCSTQGVAFPPFPNP